MGLFQRKDPLEQEWRALEKQETRFLRKRAEKSESFLNQKLQKVVPAKLQGTLDAAFEKAFMMVFEKGTGIIEKTYNKEKIKVDSKLSQYAAEVIKDKKSLRAFSKKAKDTGNKNLVLSGVSGVGLGILGIGIPDIPLFTGMMLKNIYEIALHYGYDYETEEERYYILLLIEGAVSYGERLRCIDEKINAYIVAEKLPKDYQRAALIKETAGLLSKELLYMKFLQGLPVAGAIGGVYDAVYMKQVTEYAALKYRRRFLTEQSWKWK